MGEREKGKVEEVKGDVKQRIGGATKDRSMQGEGWVEEKKGQVRQGIENLKDKVSKRDDPDHTP